MKYDFDKGIDRLGTQSLKWEFVFRGRRLSHWDKTSPSLGSGRVLPMWVADMDFPCPQPVVEALIARARHGIYGYTVATDSYYEAVRYWMKERHAWPVEREWILVSPGVVPALYLLVRTFTGPGEKVLIQRPVYYPFTNAVEDNDAEVVSNSLVNDGGRYRMDLEDLQTRLRDPQVRMVILCSPHNPVGRVWTREELLQFGEICLQHDVLVISDEIHADLVYPTNRFTPFASLSEACAQNSITCTAPSKTFNVAGLHTSNIIIPNPDLRSRFKKTLARCGFPGHNPFGLEALVAAYRHGTDWLEQVLAYIENNYRYLADYITENIPKIKVIQPEGTYLVWLDCRGLGLDRHALENLMFNEAKMYLDEGYLFGPEGEGFERINIACPKETLVEALGRIKTAVDRLK